MTNKTNFMINFIFVHWTIIIIIVFTGQQLFQFYFFL